MEKNISNQTQHTNNLKANRILVVGPEVLKKIGIYDEIHKSNTTTENENVEKIMKKGINEEENNHIMKKNKDTNGMMKSKGRSSKKMEKNVLNDKIDDSALVSNVDFSNKNPRRSGRKNAGARMNKILKKDLNDGKIKCKLENIDTVNNCEQRTINNISLKNREQINTICVKNAINLNTEHIDTDLKKVKKNKKRLRSTETDNLELEVNNLKKHYNISSVKRNCKYSSHVEEKDALVLECSKAELQISDTKVGALDSNISKEIEHLESLNVASKTKKNRLKKNITGVDTDIPKRKLVTESCETNVSCTIVPQKKKRGRLSKQINLTCSENNNIKLEIPTEQIKYEEKSNCETNESVDLNKPLENNSPVNKSYTAKKGRPKKHFIYTKPSKPVFYNESFMDNCVESNIQNKKRKTDKVNTGKSVVKCVKCNKYLFNAEWINHNQNFHNNLSWREGETPINLNDECLVKCILTKLCKKKKSLRCEKCREKKLSVYGLLSHEVQCGKTIEEISAVKVTCSLCQRVLLPLSLETHMKIHQKPKIVNKNKQDNDVIIKDKGKRNAATKALDRFKEFNDEADKQEDDNVNYGDTDLMYTTPSQVKKIPSVFLSKWKVELNLTGKAKCRSKNCEFIGDTINEIKEHYIKCIYNSKRAYSCKKCKFIANNESEIITHVKEHNDFEESESEEEEVEKEKNKPGSNINLKCYKSLPFKNQYEVPSYVYKKTKEYYSNCLEHLFIKQASIWQIIDDEYKYLPSTKESIKMATLISDGTKESVLKKDLKWRKLNLFESETDNKQCIIFCGGPVWALGWVPMLEVNSDQYLAVSCNRDMDKFHEVGSLYREEGLIQIWNFGILNNSINNLNEPMLSFGIAHNYGPIWCMEWCPRGCYQSKKANSVFKRLGLLAVTSTDGFVYVLSVPSPDDLSEGSIISVQPVFKLTIGTIENIEDFSIQPTKVTWCKNGDHNLLAGGFNNGLVCLWNLKSMSPLLKTEKNGIIELLPYHLFYPHKTMITGLHFSYFHENRWLLTSALDVGSKIWDLEDLSVPVSINKKATATDAIWCAHWNCYCVCYDNSCLPLGSGSTLTSVREWGFKTIQFYGSNSAVGCLSQNMWVNGMVQCSSLGETQLIFPNHLFFGVDADNITKRKCWIIGHTEYDKCVSISKDTQNLTDCKKNDDRSKENSKDHEEPLQNYNDIKDNFGIIFKDYKMVSPSIILERTQKMATNSENKKLSSIGAYPIESINKVSWNPNPDSYQFLAFGYQAGFLRIRCVDFTDIKIGN